VKYLDYVTSSFVNVFCLCKGSIKQSIFDVVCQKMKKAIQNAAAQSLEEGIVCNEPFIDSKRRREEKNKRDGLDDSQQDQCKHMQR
jgi:hypothetical protein